MTFDFWLWMHVLIINDNDTVVAFCRQYKNVNGRPWKDTLFTVYKQQNKQHLVFEESDTASLA